MGERTENPTGAAAERTERAEADGHVDAAGTDRAGPDTDGGAGKREPERLERYQDRTTHLAVFLGLLFVVAYGVQIAWPGLPSWVLLFARGVNLLIWVAFAADLVVRAVLHGQPLRYLVRHPLAVLLVILPIFRPLIVLRVFTVTHALLGRGGRFSFVKSTQAIAGSSALLVLVGALAVLDAERGVQGANIQNLGDALWWAMATVTTVGYGDVYPVTALGRIVAVALMVVGISLVGAVTATIGAWFVEQTRRSE